MSKNSVKRDSTSGAVGSDNIKLAGNDNKDKMYEPKHKRKLVRVLTVVAYVFSVSLAAIMLSLFYIFIYNPGKGAGGKEQTTTDSDNLPPQKQFPRINEDSLHPINSTFSLLESEEPRALPLKEMEPLEVERQEGKPERIKDFAHSEVKLFGNSANENKTRKFTKLLALL